VLGIYGVEDAAGLAYYGLHSLQHRGQQGCGIVTVDSDGDFHRVKGDGLVTEVFNEEKIGRLKGSMAIGHVRYSNAGCKGAENIQPFLFHHNSGDFALANNGQITNYRQLRDELEDRGSLFQSSSDAEVLAHLIKKQGVARDLPRIHALKDALNQIDGAFAFVVMTGRRIYACRDKYGFHPLAIGKLGNGYVVASETCAFDVIGAEYIRDVEPGEIVTLDHHGLRSQFYAEPVRHAMCAMEYVYFARPDSDIEGCNVHNYRKESGKILYRESPADADIVIGVPDSSLSAAQGYAEASGLPYEMGLIKNKYVGRTFILPTQALREKGVKMKLSPVRSIVKDKRVILVDDSIVRGTTSLKIVKMLREAGAAEVHVRIASAPLKYTCFYGVDVHTPEELISNSNSVEQVRKMIDADSLAFLSHEGMLEAGHRDDLCLACFNQQYPTKLY
jgi:amidophosphoribosyltransferase